LVDALGVSDNVSKTLYQNFCESVQRANINNKIQTINKTSVILFDAKKEPKKLFGVANLPNPLTIYG